MVEGARLESACTLTRCTEGSNPSLSAILRPFDGAQGGEPVEPQAQVCNGFDNRKPEKDGVLSKWCVYLSTRRRVPSTK